MGSPESDKVSVSGRVGATQTRENTDARSGKESKAQQTTVRVGSGSASLGPNGELTAEGKNIEIGAAKSGEKTNRARRSETTSQSVKLRFVIAIVVVGLLLTVIRLWPEGRSPSLSNELKQKPDDKSASQATPPQATEAKDRVYVDLTPWEIASLVEAPTSHAREVLTKERLGGKWVKLELPLEDLSRSTGGFRLDTKSPDSAVFAALDFDGLEYFSSFSHLTKGDLIRVEGEVHRVVGADRVFLELRHCELLREGRSRVRVVSEVVASHKEPLLARVQAASKIFFGDGKVDNAYARMSQPLSSQQAAEARLALDPRGDLSRELAALRSAAVPLGVYAVRHADRALASWSVLDSECRAVVEGKSETEPSPYRIRENFLTLKEALEGLGTTLALY